MHAASRAAPAAVHGAKRPRRRAACASDAPTGTVTLPTGYPERPFVRVKFDKLTWRPTEGNTLGVETAVVEGDPSKPGYYLTINHFPAGVMSRPHYHPDERYVIVLRGTWHTDEGDVFRPKQADPAEAGRLHATSQRRPALRRRAERGYLGRDQRLRSDQGHRHRRRRAVRTVSLVHHAASIPCSRLIGVSAGDAMNASSARAASGCADARATPPENVVIIWMSGGNCPTTSIPSPPSSLSC